MNEKKVVDMEEFEEETKEEKLPEKIGTYLKCNWKKIAVAVGAVLNCVVNGPGIEMVVYGAFMGLASTGLHQAFKSFIEGKSTEEDAADGVHDIE